MVLPKPRSDVLRTLAYADIFDYPLTLTEINHWLISSSVITSLSGKITKTNGYYTLTNRSHLIKLRQARSRFSQEKLQLARRVGEWLKSIPTIKLVAVTGALAMRNSDPNDDIDLMIVTSPNTLWFTRVLVVPLVSLIAKRRKPETSRYQLDASRYSVGASSAYSNSICLNLWLDTTALAVPPPKRNLYTAHEVAQVKPLWSRTDAHHRFLSANSWIKSYLPNIKIKSTSEVARLSRAQSRETPRTVSWLNQLAFRLQLWYMRPRLTRETVTLHAAFFHPRDTARLVMRQYRRRLINLGIKP